jgi:hypothetical protein
MRVVTREDIARDDERDVQLLSRLWAGLSRGNVSRQFCYRHGEQRAHRPQDTAVIANALGDAVRVRVMDFPPTMEKIGAVLQAQQRGWTHRAQPYYDGKRACGSAHAALDSMHLLRGRRP